MTIQMFDTTTPEAIPPNPQAVAGYVSGKYGFTWWRDLALFSGAHHLSIAPWADDDAECLDVETGLATPDEVPAWVRRQQKRGIQRPVIYAQVSTMPMILSVLEADGLSASAIRMWTAHYTYESHFCGPGCGFGLHLTADATQWNDKALGRNLDESIVSDSFFGPPPPPPDPNHYDRYPVGPFAFRDQAGKVMRLNERAIVQEYDHLRVHPRMNAKKLDELREPVTFLRKRVWYVAHYDPQTGEKRPAVDWSSYHRGWRWQMLLARSRDEVVAQ
jgi:hypothetical protein